MTTGNDDSDAPCVFCDIVAGRIPSERVHEDETTLAFMDTDPGTEGHLLVVPERHSRDLLEVPDGDLTATMLVARRIARAVYAELGAEGVDLLNCCGEGGWQTVFHFHIHVIPRYRDPSREPYVPGMPSDPQVRARCARLLSTGLRTSR
ncbi:HIT family protein [Microbacterium sp. OR16]|uniref:HIT family protein n=1 Tax=Microbacterium sp. OR16 TaxID=3095345 RepID=UPI0039B658A1